MMPIAGIISLFINLQESGCSGLKHKFIVTLFSVLISVLLVFFVTIRAYNLDLRNLLAKIKSFMYFVIN